MAIDFVSFPMKNGWIFHCYVNVYQRVYRSHDGSMVLVYIYIYIYIC